MRRRVLQQVDLPFERGVFVGVAELRRRDLFHLETKQIDFSSTRPFVAAHRRQRRIDLRYCSPSATQCRQVDTRERVEGGALGGPAEQALVLVLTV